MNKFFPTSVELESTSICNVNPPCVMCCRNIFDGKKHLQDYVVDKMEPYWKYFKKITFHGIGEVMFYPKLDNLLRLSRHCHTGFTTGGHLFNEKNIKSIVDNNLDFISVSIDAGTKETHDKIRNTGFEKIINGIKQLQEYKYEQKKSRPHLIMNATLMRWNVEEVPLIFKLAWELDAYHVTFTELNDDMDYIRKANNSLNIFNYVDQKTRNCKELYDKNIAEAISLSKALDGTSIDYCNFLYDRGILNNLPEVDISGFKKQVPNTRHFPSVNKSEIQINQNINLSNNLICSRPWETIWVNHMGDIKMCCHQMEDIGSLRDQTFEEVWFGDKANKIREAMLNGGPSTYLWYES